MLNIIGPEQYDRDIDIAKQVGLKNSCWESGSYIRQTDTQTELNAITLALHIR